MNLTDEQIMNSALISLKHLRIMYTYLTEEAGTNDFFKITDECMQEITNLQRKTYDKIVAEGWMKPMPQTSTNIEKAYKKSKTVLEEMN